MTLAEPIRIALRPLECSSGSAYDPAVSQRSNIPPADSAPGARKFRRLATITVAAVYFLILVGGVVRATGSGMGCPDWPQCFGRWIPPTSEEQLPADYQIRYADHGYGDQTFNAAKTWTEYVNRLIGVAIGLFIVATTVASAFWWRRDRAIVWWCVTATLLVGFQGWLGSVVVSTNLAPWMVTVHMLVALVIVGVLIYALLRSENALAADPELEPDRLVGGLFVLCLALSLVQIAMGTQVREGVDRLAAESVARADWIASLGGLVLVHRSFSLLLLVANGLLAQRLWRTGSQALRPLTLGLLVILGLEIVGGAIMFYFAIPAWLQPVHLTLAAVLCGIQFALALRYRSLSGARRARLDPVTQPA